MKPGKSLEYVVSTLERVLTGSENITVNSPAKLRDRTNGKLREHDVLITNKQGHHILHTAIECRDLSRKITVNQVEGFHQKCADTGVSKGVIVSSIGFWKSAKKKAEHLNISCLLLEEVDTFQWISGETFKSYSWRQIKTHIVFKPKANPTKKPTNFKILDQEGNEFTTALIEQNIRSQIANLDRITSKEGIHPIKIRMLMPNFTLRDIDSDESIEITHANIYTEIEVSVKENAIRKVKYSDDTNSELISELAIAKIEAGAMSGHLVFARSKKNGTTISFVHEPQAKETTRRSRT